VNTRRIIAAVLLAVAGAAAAQAPAPVRVITFDGGWNLPL